jgi:4-aminobutyrate aminotransferase-like enzyme
VPCSRSSSSRTARRNGRLRAWRRPSVEQAAARGLLLLKAGIHSNCIRVLCPLVLTDEQLEEALVVWEEALAAALGA